MMAPIDLDDVVSRALVYKPQSISDAVWEAIRPLLLEALAELNPLSVTSFYRDTRGMLPFLTWCHLRGFALDRSVVFHPEHIETWSDWAHDEVEAKRTRLTKNTVTDYASLLRRLGPKLNPDAPWPPRASRVPGGVKKGLRTNYSDAEVVLLDRGIAKMPDGDRKRLAVGTLAMGLGFGPQVAEAQKFRGRDLLATSEGVFAQIHGKNERLVPVSEPWATRLTELALLYPDEPFVKITDGRNAYANAARSINLGKGVPAVSPQRMRTSWMVDRLRAGVDPRHLRDWAGLESLSFLLDMTEFLPEQDDATALAAMLAPVRERP